MYFERKYYLYSTHLNHFCCCCRECHYLLLQCTMNNHWFFFLDNVTTMWLHPNTNYNSWVNSRGAVHNEHPFILEPGVNHYFGLGLKISTKRVEHLPGDMWLISTPTFCLFVSIVLFMSSRFWGLLFVMKSSWRCRISSPWSLFWSSCLVNLFSSFLVQHLGAPG